VTLLLAPARAGPGAAADLSSLLKAIRRVAIILIVGPGYPYYRCSSARHPGPHRLLVFSALLLSRRAWSRRAVAARQLYRHPAGWRRASRCGSTPLLLPTLLGSASDPPCCARACSACPGCGRRPCSGQRPGPADPRTLWSLAVNMVCYLGIPLLTAPACTSACRRCGFLGESGAADQARR